MSEEQHTVDYHNDTGHDDDGFWEWWEVYAPGADHFNDYPVCRCDERPVAHQLAKKLDAYPCMVKALESLEAATRGDDGAQTIIGAIQQCKEALAVARQAEALEGDSDA